MTYEEVISRFRNVKRRGVHSFLAECPCHVDSKPSLGITEQEDGKIVMNCLAGCDTKDILEAVGLSMRDLFNTDPQKVFFPATQGEPEALYLYRDEQDKLLYVKARFPGKVIRYGQLDPTGRFKGESIKGIRRVPYMLPELLEAAKAGGAVYYVEGEKDADTLTKLGLTATTAGGTNDWRAAYATYFKGTSVVVLPDNDTAGYKLAAAVQQDLKALGVPVKVVQTSTADKGDVTDWFNEGHTREELLQLCSAAPESQKPKLTIRTLASIKPERVKWLWYPYLPQGKVVLLRADGGTGKTWLELSFAASVSTGRPFLDEPDDEMFYRKPAFVLLQNAEDGFGDTIRPRLDSIGFGDLDKIVNIPEFENPLTFQDARIAEFMEEYNPALAIFDPVQSYLGTGVNMNLSNEVRPIMDHIGRLADKYKCTVLISEHLNKATKQDVQYRGSGSQDLFNYSRSVLLLGRDPQDPERRILAPIKGNLAPDSQSIAFRIKDGVHFDCYSDLTGNEIIGVRVQQRKKPSFVLDRAKKLLTDILGEKGYALVTDIKEQAYVDGVSRGSLYKAKDELGLVGHTFGFGAIRQGWWAYPHITKDDIKPPEQQKIILP